MPSEPESGPITSSTPSCSTDLAGGAYRAVRAGIGGADDEFDFAATGHVVGLREGRPEATHPVFSKDGVCPFECRKHPDLERFSRKRGRSLSRW